ncbi:hypothetical protein A2U01_0077048, partial [Trifolium medium]|nr:hypothetical protein [Trifolium medium]
MTGASHHDNDPINQRRQRWRRCCVKTHPPCRHGKNEQERAVEADPGDEVVTTQPLA